MDSPSSDNNIKNNRFLSKLKESIRTISFTSVLVVLIVQLIALVFSFYVFGVMPVKKEIESLKKGSQSVNTENQQLFSSSQIDLLEKLRGLKHQESFLKSAIQFAKVDSVSLLIDLNDSIAFLSYKGVSLFSTKIPDIFLNKGLNQMPTYLRDSLFAGPMQIEHEISSIEKFPVIVKKAPKDTSEIKQSDSIPVIPKQNDVYYLFAFSNNFVVEVQQYEEASPGSKKSTAKYEIAKANWFEQKSIDALKDNEKRSYIYHLVIKLPRNDAQSIYRALPQKPYLAIRYR
jgi:hypothetical protein